MPTATVHPEKPVYRCAECGQDQDHSDDIEEACSQCGTVDQFYLAD